MWWVVSLVMPRDRAVRRGVAGVLVASGVALIAMAVGLPDGRSDAAPGASSRTPQQMFELFRMGAPAQDAPQLAGGDARDIDVRVAFAEAGRAVYGVIDGRGDVCLVNAESFVARGCTPMRELSDDRLLATMTYVAPSEIGVAVLVPDGTHDLTLADSEAEVPLEVRNSAAQTTVPVGSFAASLRWTSSDGSRHTEALSM
jgi:hypothetical protein